MPLSQRVQEQFRTNFPQWNTRGKISEVDMASRIQDKLVIIEERVIQWKATWSKEIRDEVISLMDVILSDFPKVPNLQKKILEELYELDKKRWLSFIWEQISWNDQNHHEDNAVGWMQQRGISPDKIISLAKQNTSPKNPLEGLEREIVRKLVWIYGATTAFILSVKNK